MISFESEKWFCYLETLIYYQPAANLWATPHPSHSASIFVVELIHFFPPFGAVVGELSAIFPCSRISPFTWTGRLWFKRGSGVTLFLQLIQGKSFLLLLCSGDAMPPHLLYHYLCQFAHYITGHGKLNEAHPKDPWWSLPALLL